jgi:hypothetical protein
MENGAWRTEYGKWRMMNYIEDHKFQENHKLNSPLKREPVPIYREAGGVSAVFRRSPRYIPTRYQYSSLQKCGEACRNTRCPENRLFNQQSNIPIPRPLSLSQRERGAEQRFNAGNVLMEHRGIFPPLQKGGHRGDIWLFNHQSPAFRYNFSAQNIRRLNEQM